MGRERPRERDALLLAAGEFRRIVVHALRKADRGKLSGGALEGVRRARELERHRDILQGGHGGDEMKTWNTIPIFLAAEAGEGILVERAEILPRDMHACRRPAAPGRRRPSAASICPSRTARQGRSPRRCLYAGRYP